jgi:uncharacterized protein DUF995
MDMFRLTLAVVGLGAVLGIHPAAAADAAAAAAKATPLTTEELYRLYNNRSWIWKDGAGYFASKQHAFSAWSKEGGKASYGEGRWFLTQPGKLCFRANWVAKDGQAPALTCFSHRKKGGVIFQKREPGGEWYVFRNNPARKDDEAAKLRGGDRVSSRLAKTKARIA